MSAYNERITSVMAACPGLSRANAHTAVRATAEGAQLYREHLAASGITGRATAAPAVTASAAPDRYLLMVERAKESMGAVAAHRHVMRNHRELYAEHLRARGIVK